MKVFINHDYDYQVTHLIKIFDDVTFVAMDEADLINTIEDDIITIKLFDKVVTERVGHDIKQTNGRILYDVLSDYFKRSNPWGTLVGVRPVKVVHKLLEEGVSFEEMEQVLEERYRLEKNKISLITEVAKREKPFLEDYLEERKLSLYICIPFCPTRCLYCSFPSNDLRKKNKLVEPYIECLLQEIEEAFKEIEYHNYSVDCIYIGGGTPSILSEDQFDLLLSKLNHYVDLETLKEFTIEAGRPDTITEEKFDIFSQYHVSRICINPQTMNDRTLKIIGRDHNAEEIERVMIISKKYRFDVNMDLIIGLPDEDLEDVENTLKKVVAMDPENITIHTLAVKTSSRLKERLEEYEMTQSELVEEMLKISEDYMKQNDFYPYYLYRQKNMVGNFENVGYAKSGHESLYNIRIIEEKHNILALGAGAVSKKCYPIEDRFERIANIKGIEDYINRIDDVIRKQKQFFDR